MDNLSTKLRRISIIGKVSDFWLKYETKIVLILGLILVSVLSFQFGFIEGKNKQSDPIIIELSPLSQDYRVSSEDNLSTEAHPKASKTAREAPATINDTKTPTAKCSFVGSKNSDKYYPPTCQWAKRIKPENMICFESKEVAEKQGRIAGKGC